MYILRMDSCRNTLIYGSEPLCLVFFHMVRAGAYWHKLHDIHTCPRTTKVVRYLVWISQVPRLL